MYYIRVGEFYHVKAAYKSCRILSGQLPSVTGSGTIQDKEKSTSTAKASCDEVDLLEVEEL